MPEKLSLDEFINRSNRIFENKYDYSYVDYKNTRTKVCIVCPIHGKFYQTPKLHLHGNGCPLCSPMCAKTSEKFIEDSKKLYGDRYDYSKVNYINNRTPICLIDKEFGEYWETPKKHLSKRGGYPKRDKINAEKKEKFMAECVSKFGDIYDFSKMEFKGMLKETTIIDKDYGKFDSTPKAILGGYNPLRQALKIQAKKDKFIQMSYLKYRDKYNLSDIGFVNEKTKISILCAEHGVFKRTPNEFLLGKECPSCMRFDKNNFIAKATEKYGNKYSYDKVKFPFVDNKICVTCPTHGDFWIKIKDFLYRKECPKCAPEIKSINTIYTTKSFIEAALKKHIIKYDYSKTNYNGYTNKVCIICHEKDEDGKEHGEFWQSPNSHLSGFGCPKCGKVHKYTTDEWIKLAKSAHGESYSYSKSEYISARDKICITCPKHGDFWQYPKTHVSGHGCPKCNSSHLEEEMEDFLKTKGIKYIYQKRFLWLGLQSLDFYLPDYHVGIECQGIQHFKETNFFQELALTKELDSKKLERCTENGVRLFYYSNLGIKYPYEVIEDKEKLIEKIIKKK